MSDGTYALLGGMILLLLLWGDWFEEGLKESRLRKRTAALYLLFFTLSTQLEIPLWGGSVGLSLFLFPIPFLYFTRLRRIDIPRLLGNGLILAASLSITQEVLDNDPVLMVMEEPWMSAGFTGLLLMLISSHLSERILSLLLGIILNEAFFYLMHGDEMERFSFLPAYKSDLFFLILLLIPFYTLIKENVMTRLIPVRKEDKMKRDVRL